jgi:hypothetical protein
VLGTLSLVSYLAFLQPHFTVLQPKLADLLSNLSQLQPDITFQSTHFAKLHSNVTIFSSTPGP